MFLLLSSPPPAPLSEKLGDFSALFNQAKTLLFLADAISLVNLE